MVTELNPNGTFLLNTTWTVDELDEKLPAKLKRQLAAKNANFYIINGTAIGRLKRSGATESTQFCSCILQAG